MATSNRNARDAPQAPHLAGRLQPGAGQDDQLVQGPMPLQQGRRPTLHNPGQQGPRELPSQGIEHGKTVDHVAHRAEPANEYPGFDQRQGAFRWHENRGIGPGVGDPARVCSRSRGRYLAGARGDYTGPAEAAPRDVCRPAAVAQLRLRLRLATGSAGIVHDWVVQPPWIRRLRMPVVLFTRIETTGRSTPVRRCRI